MRELFEVFLKWMEKRGQIKGAHKIVYKGRGVSTNDYYNSGHWSNRHRLKKKYLELLYPILAEELSGKKLDKFGIVMFYNSRHDTDNVVGFEKLFLDIINKDLDVIKEDNKKHYRMLTVIPDESLDTNTFEFHLLDYGED